MASPMTQTMQLPSPLAPGTGAALDCFRFRDKTVQVAGSFSATVVIEGTVDGTNWVTVDNGTFASAGGLIEVFPTFKQLRVHVTAYTSGTPLVTFGGFDERAI